MTKQPRPNIFLYTDCIVFLNDWIAFLKKTQTDFSTRNLSKKSQIAIGYINMVLSKKRNLSERAFLKISPHLKLKDDEVKFFNLLRLVSLSENSEIRLQTLNEIMKFKKFKIHHENESTTFKYLSNWHYVAIYEMLNITNFNLDAVWIQKKLKKNLSLLEIQESIDFLKLHKFIKLNDDGKWIQAQPHLNCTDGIYKISLTEFHRQIFELAKDAIENSPREERLIMGQTMAISLEDFEKIKEIIQSSIQAINNVNINTTDKQNVYHIEIAAFALTKTEG